MELKVECACGTRFAFDVEPVDGKMPFSVNCPACGTDGTETANSIIASSAPKTSPAMRPKLGIARTPSHASPAPAAAASSPAPAAPTSPAPSVSGTAAKGASKPKRQSFILGVLGAMVGGAIGLLAWYLVIKFTNREFGLLAWGIGGLAGIGARIGMSNGSPALGAVAATCALVAILGGEYLAIRNFIKDFVHNTSTLGYDMKMAEAKAAVELKTDADIKKHLAEKSDSTETDASRITAKQVSDFKKNELPEYKAWVGGKPSREEFEATTWNAFQEKMSIWDIVKTSGSFWTVLFVFFGISTAWKIAANEDAA